MKKLLTILEAAWFVATLIVGLQMANDYVNLLHEAVGLPHEEVQLDE